MRYRLLGGLAGWLVAVLPLVAVNAANVTALFSFQETIVAGGLAILVGLLLGGVSAGAVGGQQRRDSQGGASGGAAAGGFAALFYLLTVLGLLALASHADSAPLLLQGGLLGALWMITALAFVALLLVAIATAVGALAGRRAPKSGRSAGSSSRPGSTSRQPIPPRTAPGQALRLPSGPANGPRSMPRSAAPDAYPPLQRTPASAPRPRGASSRMPRQP